MLKFMSLFLITKHYVCSLLDNLGIVVAQISLDFHSPVSAQFSPKQRLLTLPGDLQSSLNMHSPLSNSHQMVSLGMAAVIHSRMWGSFVKNRKENIFHILIWSTHLLKAYVCMLINWLEILFLIHSC